MAGKTEKPIAETEHPAEEVTEVHAEAGEKTGDLTVEEQASEEGAPVTDRLDKHPRFREVIAEKNTFKDNWEKEREARIRAETERDTLRQKGDQAKPQRRFTWAELEKFVEDGTHTREQVETYKEQSVELRVQEGVAKAEGTRDVLRDLRDQTARYDTLVPGWDTAGTETNQKVMPEFRRLLRMGLPDTYSTQLLALEHAFGKPEVLERAKRSSELTRQHRETHVEHGGDGGLPPSTNGKPDPLKLITPAERSEYQELIKSGQYPGGWEEVRAELQGILDSKIATSAKANLLARVK